MPGFIIIGYLQTTSKEARTKVRQISSQPGTWSSDVRQIIEELEVVAEFTRKHEPDTLQYAITIPIDESDETSVYVIEE